MNKVYVLGGLRSHIGLKNGVFKNIPAEILAAKLLSKLQEKYGWQRDRADKEVTDFGKTLN